MKKLIALLLAMLLVFSFAACGGNEEPTEPATEAPTEAPTEPVAQVKSLSVVIQNSATDLKTLIVRPNEDGTMYVEMRGEITKIGNLDASILEKISIALEESGMKAFHEQSVMGENPEVYGGMFIEIGEEFLSADFSGEIPEEFAQSYAALEKCFVELTAELPEYVPSPVIVGVIPENDLASINAIIGGLTLDNPEAFGIAVIPTDDAEVFAYSAGLPSTEGIASAVNFYPNMNASAYSLVIVTLTEGTDAEVIAKSFEENIDWLKWVCVQPDSAAIAIKDNQVLCLLGSGEIFAQTVTAMDAAGWVPVANLENPNLEG